MHQVRFFLLIRLSMVPGAASGVASSGMVCTHYLVSRHIYIYIYIYLVIGNSLHGLDVPPYTSLPRCSPSSTASRGYSSPTNHPPHSILTTHSCHTSPVILRYHRYPLGWNSTRPLPPPFPSTYQRPTHDPPHYYSTREGSRPPTRPPPSTMHNRSLPVPQSSPPSTSPMLPPIRPNLATYGYPVRV